MSSSLDSEEEEKGVFKCAKCPAIFTRGDSAVRHEKEVHSEKGWGWNCPEEDATGCQFQARGKRWSDMRDHLGSRHPGHPWLGLSSRTRPAAVEIAYRPRRSERSPHGKSPRGKSPKGKAPTLRKKSTRSKGAKDKPPAETATGTTTSSHTGCHSGSYTGSDRRGLGE